MTAGWQLLCDMNKQALRSRYKEANSSYFSLFCATKMWFLALKGKNRVGTQKFKLEKISDKKQIDMKRKDQFSNMLT